MNTFIYNLLLKATDLATWGQISSQNTSAEYDAANARVHSLLNIDTYNYGFAWAIGGILKVMNEQPNTKLDFDGKSGSNVQIGVLNADGTHVVRLGKRVFRRYTLSIQGKDAMLQARGLLSVLPCDRMSDALIEWLTAKAEL